MGPRGAGLGGEPARRAGLGAGWVEKVELGVD